MLRRPFLICLIALGLAGCGDRQAAADRPRGGDFVLQSADGPVDTRALRGNVLLVFFGYTNCPDVCPASLAAGAQALIGLSADERAKTRLIMVSVDPERDSPAKLKEYAAYFHTGMVGVTGTPEEIAAVAKSYGAGYVRQPADASGRYAVDHTANTYLVGPDGKLAATIPLGTPTVDLVAAIRKQLQ
ncbi:MAG: SCO family protein [Rhodocyclales bacterium]|nr:SCO family protein [Rhodocyclales bacterium]